MSPEEIKMHLTAGRYYGRKSTCQPYGPDKKGKIQFTEEKASEQVKRLNSRPDSYHTVEAYPCYWCSDRFPDSDELDFTHLYWHVGREMDDHERDLFSSDDGSKLLDMEEITISVAEASLGFQQGLVGLRVHNRKLCEGRPCSIHHPSDHHMKDWPLNWRGDRRIMERLCRHFNDDGELEYTIGHPDPDDAAFREARDGENADPGVHGCDGCCFKEEKK